MGHRHGRVRLHGGMYRSYSVLQGVDNIIRWTFMWPAVHPGRSPARCADQAANKVQHEPLLETLKKAG